MNKLIRAAVAAAMLAGAGSAIAATANDSFQVTATVLSSCSVTASDLAFGAYTPSAVDYDAAAANNISVSCTANTAFNVGLNAGTAPGATTATRRMVSTLTGDELAYQLYTTAGRTTAWGETIGTDTVASNGAGVGTPVLFSVYGRIPGSAANQSVEPSADYADTVTVTITY